MTQEIVLKSKRCLIVTDDDIEDSHFDNCEKLIHILSNAKSNGISYILVVSTDGFYYIPKPLRWFLKSIYSYKDRHAYLKELF